MGSLFTLPRIVVHLHVILFILLFFFLLLLLCSRFLTGKLLAGGLHGLPDQLHSLP